MRRTLLFAVSLVFLVGCISAESATEIRVQDRSPSISEPSDTVKMTVVVANNGNSDADYGSLEVETVDRVEYLGTTSNYQDSFSLCGGCQTIGTVYLKVSENASSGSYPVDFSIENSDSVGMVEKAVLDVDGEPKLLVKGEGSVIQGEDSEISVEIENTGKDTATQVTASLDQPLMSFDYSKLNFGTLDVGESLNRTVEIDTDEKVESGPESIPVRLSYIDDERKGENTSLSVNVLKDVKLAVSQVSSDAVVGSQSRLMVELENIGESEADEIESKLECEDSEVTDSESFVGSLDSDESVPTVYRLIPQEDSTQCTIEYKRL